MTRREASEKIFNYIRENNFKPIDIKYGNGYFVFDMGNDGVVHFNIKGLYGWKFAMWIETNPDKLISENGKKFPAIQFFCQHKLNINKFKPSRSFFLKNFYLEDIEECFGFYHIRDMIQMIKRHPFISFAMDAYEDKFYNKSYIGCYLDMKFYRIKQSIKEWSEDTWIRVWHGSKVWFLNKYNVVDTAKLVDQNSDGWKVSPRYEMRIHFKKISDSENEQENAEIKMLDRWFRKNYYNNMYLELTRDGIKERYIYQMND